MIFSPQFNTYLFYWTSPDLIFKSFNLRHLKQNFPA
jgi:hypothetical protein